MILPNESNHDYDFFTKADDYSFIGDLCYFPECDMNESKDKTKQDGNALE